MILPIVQFGHPALRAKGRRIEKIDSGVIKLAEDMFETMHDADGIGLAAQQVGLAVQLFVVDVTGTTDRPSVLRVNGAVVDLGAHMPLVLINPEVEKIGPVKAGVEGCLSFPGLSGSVERPVGVRVKATSLEGKPLVFEAEGLLARAIQHEHDHLNGILFIDRLNDRERAALASDIERLMRQNAVR